jgi:site-specific recombinase XerD
MASASSTSTHSTVTGICSGKKRIVVPGQKRLPHALSEDQVRQLLGHVRNTIPRTCLATMYACGLRIGEATRLEIRSVDRASQVLRIIGKGDKERLVLLPQPVLDELGTVWRTHRNPRWLFPNRCGDGPLNQRVLSHTFAAAADAAGLRHGVTSHALRHSYATRLIENESMTFCGVCRGPDGIAERKVSQTDSHPTKGHALFATGSGEQWNRKPT